MLIISKSLYDSSILSKLLTLLIIVCLIEIAFSKDANSTKPAVCPFEAFYSPLLGQEDMFHGIGVGSDGNVYIGTSTHDLNQSAKLMRFSPKERHFEELADMGELTQTPVGKDGFVPQGKIHTPFFENKGILYFATHVALVSQKTPENRKPYPGGCFIGFNLKKGKFTKLASAPPGEGVITLTADFSRNRLYALTYPSALFLILELSSSKIRSIGTVGGKLHNIASEIPFRHVCRYLAVDSITGRVYGSRDDGSIFYYDPPTDQLAEANVNVQQGIALNDGSGTIQNLSWRSIRYDFGSKAFYGICSNGPWLFRFDPTKPFLTPLGRMAVEPFVSQKNPTYMPSLAFEIAPNQLIYHIVYGTPLTIAGSSPVKQQAHLMSYRLRDGHFTNHGALYAKNRRVLSTQSMTVAPNGTLWSVVHIESFNSSHPLSEHGTRYERALIRIDPKNH